MPPRASTVFSAQERSRVAREVLAIAGGLVSELGGTALTPSLAHSIERDLGIGSLERVELLLRLERAFGVRLTDTVMAEAVTLDDLVEAVMRSQPRVVEALPSPAAPPSAGVSAPASAATLVDVLEWHAEHAPDRVHMYLREDDTEIPLRYAELLTAAREVASGLRTLGVRRGDTVALMLRTGSAFSPTFFGTFDRGVCARSYLSAVQTGSN